MIKVNVKEFHWNKYAKEITLSFSGKLNDEKINLNARYNQDGKMAYCSSAYSSINSADYYIEVAKYFQLMKDYEGDKILEVINRILPEYSELDKELRQSYAIDTTLGIEADKLSDRKKELNKKLNRLKNEDKIKEVNVELNSINSQIDDIFKKVEENEKLSKCILEKMKDMLIDVDLTA